MNPKKFCHMRVSFIVALAAMVLVSCADSSRDAVEEAVLQFEEQHFGHACDNITIDIACQRITNAAGNATWERIDMENCARTLPHLDADTIKVAADVEPAVEAFVETLCRDARSLGVEYVYTIRQKPLYSRDNSVLCFQTETYTYAGGAHASEGLYFDCYDTSSGSAYDFGYLLDSDSEWGGAVAELLSDKLLSQHGDMLFDVSADGVYMPESVLITDTGLLLVYQPYELAPYSYGMVTVELTDEELAATGASLVWVQ